MKIEKKYVYDLFLRALHAIIAFSTLVLLLSAKFAEFNESEGYLRKAFWVIHIFAGYSLSIAFIFRIVWGFVGPEHARFSNLFHLEVWKKLIHTRNIKEVTWKWGHHPLAALAYLGFYISVFVLAISGIILSAIEHDRGPLANWLYDELTYKHAFMEVHEACSMFVILFIISHVFALFYHEYVDGVPIVQSMFSGYQYKKVNQEDVTNEKE